jgi:hypothetical protein
MGSVRRGYASQVTWHLGRKVNHFVTPARFSEMIRVHILSRASESPNAKT